MEARQNGNAAKSEPDQKLVDLIKKLVLIQERHDGINGPLENIKNQLKKIKQRLKDKGKKTDGFNWPWRSNPSEDEENKEIDEAKKEARKISEYEKEVAERLDKRLDKVKNELESAQLNIKQQVKYKNKKNEAKKEIDEAIKKEIEELNTKVREISENMKGVTKRLIERLDDIVKNELKSAKQAECKLLKEDELSLLEEEIGRFEDDATIWEDSSRLARLGVHFMEQLYATKDLKTVAERYKEVAEAIKYLGTVPEKNAIRKKWFDTIDGMEKSFKKVMERVISKEPELRNDASGKPEDTTERETGTNDQDKTESKPNAPAYGVVIASRLGREKRGANKMVLARNMRVMKGVLSKERTDTSGNSKDATEREADSNHQDKAKPIDKTLIFEDIVSSRLGREERMWYQLMYVSTRIDDSTLSILRALSNRSGVAAATIFLSAAAFFGAFHNVPFYTTMGIKVWNYWVLQDYIDNGIQFIPFLVLVTIGTGLLVKLSHQKLFNEIKGDKGPRLAGISRLARWKPISILLFTLSHALTYNIIWVFSWLLAARWFYRCIAIL